MKKLLTDVLTHFDLHRTSSIYLANFLWNPHISKRLYDMRFSTQSSLVRVAVMGVLCFATQGTRADYIVNWGGDYVANDSQNLSGNTFLGAVAGNGVSGTPFSASTAFSPAVSGAYAGTSARFYGGAILSHQNDTQSQDVFANARIKNQGGNDSVQLKATQSGHSHNMHAIFLWNQADFLTGNTPVVFDANTSASLRVGQASTETLSNARLCLKRGLTLWRRDNFPDFPRLAGEGQTPFQTEPSLRMLVKDVNDNYWLSGHAFNGLANNTTYTWDTSNQGFAAGTDGTWTAYDPTAALGTLGSGTDLHLSTINLVPQKFSGISAVGFLFDQDVYHNNLEFHWESFSVNAVPEPNGLLISAMALAVFGLRTRHRRENS